MKNILSLIEKNKNTRRKMIIIILILSVFVLDITLTLLIRPAHSLVNKDDCGIIEHTHTSKCYSEHKKQGESVLVCCSDLLPEDLSHIHDYFCYDKNGKLICPLSEYEHIHTDDCYDENGVQICGAAFHQHGEECFRILGENDSCLVLDCGKEAHTHHELCLAPQEDIQEDFAETQSIEPDFEETEIFEPEMEIYEPKIVNEIAMFAAEESSDVTPEGLELDESNIESVILQYKNAKGTWVVVTDGMENVPANATMRIEVNYSGIDKEKIAEHDNQIVYSGIPKWMNPNKTADIYDQDNNVVASLSVENGNAVIKFTQSYLNNLINHTTIDGTFSVEGAADWREINDPSNPSKLPSLDVNFKFEGDLAAKYGDFQVEKKSDNEVVEVWENGKIVHTYLKYELKVKSLENNKEIPEICITDVLSTENRINLNNVIKDNGYVGVTESKETLLNSGGDYNPYETVSGVTNYDHGTVLLDNKNLKWEIKKLQPNEERTLVYYVELNEKYVGSGSAGALRNEAKPESNGYRKESVRDEFVPKADVNITKKQIDEHINDYGNGTIDYTVVVSAKHDNSYTITDALIKDSFRDGMPNYVDTAKEIAVTIKKPGNIQETKNVSIGADGFTVPIDKLERGESVEITYSVPVKGLFSNNNGDVHFSNHASFVGGNKNGKLQNNYVFKGSGVTTTVRHNQWMRKLNGITVNNETTINITNDKNVYNYGETEPTSGITEFTIPQNAREYIVIVNEDGTWNMSGNEFVDQFQDHRIEYKGYLKIDEFNSVSDIGKKNNLSDGQVLNILNDNEPTKTVWVNIDGRNSFDVIPTKYGLTDGNKVYRLTYYAAVKPTEANIKNIVVANGFSIWGTIGTGDSMIVFNGVQTIVSSTLTGSASYDFDKESLFHEKKYYTSGNGEIYWVIRANGTLPKDLHIKDIPHDNNSMRSDSLIGAYIGNKDYDFSKITSYEELNNALSNMEELEGGTNKYFYNLQSISRPADLNERYFAIFSRGNNSSGYMMGNQKGNNNIRGESLSTRISFNDDVMTNEEVQLWYFERVNDDKFYIYYNDSSGRHYMHIEVESVTISNDPGEPLTVSIDNNQIKIANPDAKGRNDCNDGEALNWYGDNGQQIYYSGWKNINNGNNWHYLGTLDENPRYNYKPQKITDVNELNGKQFAIITPGVKYSGLLVGGETNSNSGCAALNGDLYTEHFTDNPPTDIMRSSQLQKWTFKKIDGTVDEFQVYYTKNNQNYYLKLGSSSATTTNNPVTVKISCDNGKIKLKDPDSGYALDWYGGENENDKCYCTWKDEVYSNNRLHYVAVAEEITSEASNYAFSWDNNGSIKINQDTVIAPDKSMYIVLRTHPNEALSGYFSKTFDNEIGIMDDASGQIDVLDHALYTYIPDLPLRKEGMVAVYYNAQETNPKEQWKVCSVSPKEARNDGEKVWTNGYYGVFKNERNIIQANGSGLYVEWLMNVNWDGTIDGDVILTDYLNHDMEPVIVRQFNLGATSTANPPVYKTIPELENNPDWTKSQTHEMPFYYNKKTGELKVAVGNLQKATSENNSVVNLQLICRVTDPDVIFSGKDSILTNTADLTRPDGTFIGKHTDSHAIKPAYSINKTVNGVKKSENDENYATNKLEYTIEINPLAEDLIVDGDTLPVLIDKMQGKLILTGDVEVYKKVGDDETKLDNIDLTIETNGDETKIRFENLPDQTHLIIKYKARVNVKQNQESAISNIAYWEGYDEPSKPQHSEMFTYDLSGSVRSKSHADVVINKRDPDGDLPLYGAKFEVHKVNTDGTVDTLSAPIKGTTDNDGRIHFNNNELSCDTVYQIKEIKAPADYVLDDTPKYFMVISNGHTYEIDENGQLEVNNQKVDVIIDYALGNDPDLEITIYNKKARVRVEKKFCDKSGENMNPHNGIYRFGLYYSVPTSKATPEQILSITYSDEGISYALDGKEIKTPEFTKARAGAPNFIYELNERNEPIINGGSAFLNGYSFDVEYSSNSVVGLSNGKTATVTITNKAHPIQLPMTGGIGLKKYYRTAFGVMLILFALAAATVRVRRKYKKEI